jgi:beta-hydroxylase
MFSILAPGAHIARHRGPTNAFITAHLALKVPRERDKCTIYVDDQPYHWRQGELLIFDDSRFHEVRNDTDEERVILLMHIMRPVAFPGSIMQSLFMGGIKLSPFIIDAKKSEIAWQGKFERLENEHRGA